MSNTRQPGHYWVKRDGKWMVAEWRHSTWRRGLGSFVEINETRIPSPDEQKEIIAKLEALINEQVSLLSASGRISECPEWVIFGAIIHDLIAKPSPDEAIIAHSKTGETFRFVDTSTPIRKS
jgi:hypothetical protein